jgi:regulation of enolase protein 1 (concanavalin A-like superfamily)
MEESVTLPVLPAQLRWQTTPTRWSVTDQSSLMIEAGAATDLFINPQGGPPVLNAPRLLGEVTGDFQLSTRVAVDFAATFDAGVLLVWRDEDHWAKLCFEYSPRRQPMIVSVVTRGSSDDANGFEVSGNRVWLRISRLGPAFAFHASTDGHVWHLVRHFPLDAGEPAAIGFLAQSPTGAGCAVTFEDIRFAPERLSDLRSGE